MRARGCGELGGGGPARAGEGGADALFCCCSATSRSLSPSARPCETRASSEYSAFATPATFAAEAAAACAPAPASSTCTGPPSLAAAVTAERVAPDTAPPACSPSTRLCAARAREEARARVRREGAVLRDSILATKK